MDAKEPDPGLPAPPVAPARKRPERLPSGVAQGIIAFTVATFLVTVALWPSGAEAPLPGPVLPGHGGHGEHTETPRGNIVGRDPYNGPVAAQEVVAACAAERGNGRMPCYRDTLKALLVGRGAVAAFDALDNLSIHDPATSGQGHALAHDLGRHAYVAYGGIHEALVNCSLKVFQGCLHGALQAYLETLPNVEEADLAGLCPTPDAIRRSLCVHGIGHGLMLNTNANVNRSLELCDLLPTGGWDRGSCYSGVIMENLVGFMESQAGAPHQHGNHSGPPGYMVRREGDPYYPCSVLAPQYQGECWVQQADYILYANGQDFEAATLACDAAPREFVSTCRTRIGADSWGWFHDVPRTARDCAYGNATGREPCIRGMVDAIVLYHYDPQPAVMACRQVPEDLKPACYRQVPVQGSQVADAERMAAACALADEAHIEACRLAAGLPRL